MLLEFQFYISAIITPKEERSMVSQIMFQFYISAIITLYKTSLGLIVYQDDNDCKDNTFL